MPKRAGMFVVAMFIGALAQDVIAASVEVVLPGTQDLLLRSPDGQREYRVMIAAPSGPPPAAGYPALYVLDGNGVFGAVRDEVRRQAATSYQIPALVVAIGYPGEEPWHDDLRKHDLTPAVPAGVRINGPGGGEIKGTGGADAFLAFIQKVVKPAVESRFPVDPHRQALMGHSFGGLFTLHTFFTQPDAFQFYVAMSPSIWFADEYILKEEEGYRQRFPRNPDNARLLITVGGCEQTAGECDHALRSTPVRDAWLANRGHMVSNARAMQARLAAVRGEAVQVRVIEGEHHISVIGAALSRAVRFALTSPATGPREPDSAR
jgi:predicted alpha/beta superfamily hydrolase